MEKMTERAGSTLYRRLDWLRVGLPIVFFLVALALETDEYSRLSRFVPMQTVVPDFPFYVVAGPVLVLLGMTWLAHRIRERDEAEAYLRGLYQISHQVAKAPDVESLLKIALDMPEQVLGQVAASLSMRAAAGRPWALVGTRGVTENQRAAIEAVTINAGDHLLCEQCPLLQAAMHPDCPVLAALQNSLKPAPVSAICLPLSESQPRHVLLSIYLTEAQYPSAEARHTLESLAAGLAVALDRARLRSREIQLLQQMDQAVQARASSAATLRHMLADIGAAHDAEMGAVFLAPHGHGTSSRTTFACWPGDEPGQQLAQAAQEALETGNAEVVEGSTETGQIMAIPLVAEGQHVGILVLASRSPHACSQAASLRVAASMMAMVVRNSQLYAALESQAVLEERTRLAREVHDNLAQSLGFLNFQVQRVERLLGREQWDAAIPALQEARQEIGDLYAEVRMILQDLRSPVRDDLSLADHLREATAAVARRSHLAVSFIAEGELICSPEMDVQLSHIVREALTNVHRHAQAQQAWVRLQVRPEIVTLEVKDDGIGFSDEAMPQAPGGFGLRIMQERAAAMGGQFRFHSTPGQGGLVQVTVPRDRVLASVRAGI